jgi:hypothetical protein
MKKMIFTLAAMVFLAGATQAQESRHEVYGGIGVWGTNTIIDVFSDIIVTGFTGGTISTQNDNYIGDFHLGYKYLPSKHIAFGLTFAYASNTSDAYFNQAKSGRIYNDYYTWGLEFDYRYISRPKLALYSTLGAGITLFSQEYRPESGDKAKESNAYFNFQVTPIGVKFGQYFGVFAEAGFGYKGILTLGLFGRF